MEILLLVLLHYYQFHFESSKSIYLEFNTENKKHVRLINYSTYENHKKGNENLYVYYYQVYSSQEVRFLTKDRAKQKIVDMHLLKKYHLKSMENIEKELEPMRERDRQKAEERRQRFINGTATHEDVTGNGLNTTETVKYWKQFQNIYIVERDSKNNKALIFKVKLHPYKRL